MMVGHLSRCLIGIGLCLFISSTWAVDWVCLHDTNGDGKHLAVGETRSCWGDEANPVCPINAERCVDMETGWNCPIAGNQCVDDGEGVHWCSAIECQDLDEVPPEDYELDMGMYSDDGPTDSEGNCLGTLMMFSGRAMECEPPGVSNAFQNCCRSDEEVIQDTVGSIAEIGYGIEAIKHVYQAAKVGYVAYNTAIQAGETVAAASQAGAGAAGNSLVAFDPASLAITVAVGLVLDYLMQACSATDMETALLNSSGFCTELSPPRCNKRWFGSCVQEAKVFCCFNSKLSRIINEQGREQLKGFEGFGESYSPECRGFTPEEFQAIDFSKIDFSDYYGDLRRASQDVIQSNAAQKVEAYENQFIIE